MVTRRTLIATQQELTDVAGRHRARRHGERDERGASLVEYALLVALIALVCIGAVTLLGTALEPQYSSIADGLN